MFDKLIAKHVLPFQVFSAFCVIISSTLVYRWIAYRHTPIHSVRRIYLQLRRWLFSLGVSPARHQVRVASEVSIYDSEAMSRLSSNHSKDPSHGILVKRTTLKDRVAMLMDKDRNSGNEGPNHSDNEFEMGSSFGAVTYIDGRRISSAKRTSIVPKEKHSNELSISISLTNEEPLNTNIDNKYDKVNSGGNSDSNKHGIKKTNTIDQMDIGSAVPSFGSIAVGDMYSKNSVNSIGTKEKQAVDRNIANNSKVQLNNGNNQDRDQNNSKKKLINK